MITVLHLTAMISLLVAVSSSPVFIHDGKLIAAKMDEVSTSSSIESTSTASPSLLAPVLAQINFQCTGASETPFGYTTDLGDLFGDRGNGLTYGWSCDSSTANTFGTTNCRNRGVSSNKILDSFMVLDRLGSCAGDVNWKIEVPNDTYEVEMDFADPSYGGFNTPGCSLQGQGLGNVYLSKTSVTTVTRTITVTDNSITFGGPSAFVPGGTAVASDGCMQINAIRIS